MRLRSEPRPELALAGARPVRSEEEELPAGERVEQRVRRFAVLRAAQRALAPSSPEPMGEGDVDALRGIRERLRDLVGWLDKRLPEGADAPPFEEWESVRLEDQLEHLDGALDGYARVLCQKIDSLPLAQLRASLNGETRERRIEVTALLELCMESEPAPGRYLHVLDLVITLLCSARQQDGWYLYTDPANLNEAVRARCLATDVGSEAEAQIVLTLQTAAQRLAGMPDARPVLREVAAYKKEIAPFFFAPAVLRCIVGYNVAARNHFEKRLRDNRALDSAIDDELGTLDPLTAPEGVRAREENRLPAHEAPGVLSVQECIRRRLLETEMREGPAARIASLLDLSWLASSERNAFLRPEDEGPLRIVRLTVLLGHLAVSLPHCQQDFAALGLHEAQLDAWIVGLGDEVQREINTLIQESYESAVRLGDTKSRFLAAVLIAARRRHDPDRKRGAADEGAAFYRDAIRLVREALERDRWNKPQAMFFDLFGGGWRRTAALGATLLAVGTVGFVTFFPSRGPRGIHELSERRVHDLSPLLESAYRDYAKTGSMFVATVSDDWLELDAEQRRVSAEKMRSRLAQDGVSELMLFDGRRVLRAHYKQGEWRVRAWDEE